MQTHRFLVSSLAAAWLCLTPAAHAQDSDNDLRDQLNRIERRLNEVRSIVFQARDTGKPVQVVDAASDPQAPTLQGRIDDLSQSLRSLTGQVETLTHDLDVARKQLAESEANNAALADRVDKLEKQVAPPPPPPPPGGTLGAQAQAGGGDDGGAPAGDAKAAYAHARELMLDGDYVAASAAFQDYIDHYGDTASAPQARYWLGWTRYTQGDYQGAATALIGAIRGWPRASWAPDAVIKLSLSLSALNKTPDACRTLVEFRRHYPAASVAEKAQARAAGLKAGCARAR